jgi:hypothetical protein
MFGVLALRQIGPVRLPGTEFAPKIDLPPGVYGTEPKITQFYAGTGVLTKGEHAVVCYGVQNVQAVRLDPPVEEIKPALNRCFAVAPEKTTTYTLTAQATGGRELQESFTIQVNPAAPWFSMLATGGKQIVLGERWAFCYSVENALSVRLEPLGQNLPAGKKLCLMLTPGTTMDYQLVAVGERGMTATAKMHVAVVKNK